MLYQLLSVAVAIVPCLASLQRDGALLGRQAVCNRDNLYRCFTASSAQAAPYCSTAVAPIIVTASTTVTPTATATATATVFVTTTGSTTAASTSTTTLTLSNTVTTTFTSITTFLTTTTTTATSQSPLRKRQAAGPACLTKDGSKSTSYPASRITSACNCLYPKTVTTTPTAGTVTVTVTSTVMPTVITVITISTTVPTTVSTDITTTTSTTTVTTTTSVSTATEIVTAKYTIAVGAGSSCTYNRYSDGYAVDNSPANNYALGKSQCQSYCTGRSDCKFFFYLRFDPARARGADYGFCFIDNLPYDGAYLQCGYPTQYYVGYNKIP